MRLLKVLILACALPLAACGGGGGGNNTPAGVSVASLAGNWLGVLEDNIGGLHTLTLAIDAAGNITQISIDGVGQPETGVITKGSVGTTLFSIAFSDTTIGGFLVDAGATHAAFLDEDFNVAVVQKGAAALPTYNGADIAGSWSGYGVLINASFDVTQTFASSATVANNPTRSFTGTDIFGAVTGSFPIQTGGRWIGNYTNPTSSGDVRAFLSPDKQFAGTWACEPVAPQTYNFPVDCSFSAWNK